VTRGGEAGSEAGAAALAARQDGLIDRQQLLTLGFSPRQIDYRLLRHRLFLIYPNVYALGHPRITPRARLRAALLSVGPAAFLSHRSAPAVLGLRPINVRAIEVTIIGSGGRRRNGLIVHRSTDGEDIRTTADGLRHSGILRALIELAPRETRQELARLITGAVQRRLLRLDAADGRAEVEAFLARHARRPGVAPLELALSRYRHPGASDLERSFTELLQRHPEVPPPPLRDVHIDIWEIDAYWPVQRVAVELDGRPYHVAVAAMERDRRKDIALQRLNITPLRFTDFRVATDPDGIIADLLHFLGRGGRAGPGRDA
jgi:hypothetical protein